MDPDPLVRGADPDRYQNVSDPTLLKTGSPYITLPIEYHKKMLWLIRKFHQGKIVNGLLYFLALMIKIYREKKSSNPDPDPGHWQKQISEDSISLPYEAGKSDEAVEAVPGRGEVLSEQCCQLLAGFPGRNVFF
jgi:hypothetical protein